jgi:hypothetical protein
MTEEENPWDRVLAPHTTAEEALAGRNPQGKIAIVTGGLSFAKILSSREINSLHTFLSPPICYDCSPCSPSSDCGSDCWPVVFVRITRCSWRTWHSGSNLQY